MLGIVSWLFMAEPLRSTVTRNLARVGVAVDYRTAAHEYRLIAAGHFSMAVQALPAFYLGLTLIVLGTGLLKGNVAVVVGQLDGVMPGRAAQAVGRRSRGQLRLHRGAEGLLGPRRLSAADLACQPPLAQVREAVAVVLGARLFAGPAAVEQLPLD